MNSRHQCEHAGKEIAENGSDLIAPLLRTKGSHAASAVFVCSVTSNCTGRFVFFWMMVARSRIELPDNRSSTLSLTRSQARSLVSLR
jgi:hypothetical protein